MDRLGRRAGSGKALLDHLPLVNSIAVRVHDHLPVQVDLDDLIGPGILGLCDAATTNDPRETSRLGIETGYRTCECCCTRIPRPPRIPAGQNAGDGRATRDADAR